MLTDALLTVSPNGGGHANGVWDRAEIESYCYVAFQNGPAPIYGVNGVQILDVLKICVDQARALQTADPSRNRAMVITKLDEALLWERKRLEESSTRDKAVDAARRAQ